MAGSAKSPAALEDRFLTKLNQSPALDPGLRIPECAAGDRKLSVSSAAISGRPS